MAEAFSTNDLLVKLRGITEAYIRRDFDAAAAVYSPRGVLDLSPLGIGIFEGRQAIRGLFADWFDPYEEVTIRIGELRGFGNDVTLGVLYYTGRPAGSTRLVQVRHAYTSTWTDGLIERTTAYADVDEARMAAERLAAERGEVVSAAPATADLAGVIHQVVDAVKAGDFDTALGFYAVDAVYDGSPSGGAIYVGHAEIRDLFEAFRGAYEEYGVELEVNELGGGVAFCVVALRGRLPGSTGWVQQRYATAEVWEDGLGQHVTNYTDIDAARAAAERLARERGYGVSEDNMEASEKSGDAIRGGAVSANLDLVRSIYADWERGDFSSRAWADPEIEYVQSDGPEPGRWSGLANMAEGMRGWLSGWEEFRVEADEFRELDDDRVLVFARTIGRGKRSGVELGGVLGGAANVFHIRAGQVTRFSLYFDRDRALADLGLDE
jgi:ketosteroid isomerase-like protein